MFHIHIPPLRERQDDIRGLIRFILERTRAERGGDGDDRGRHVERLLQGYPWPATCARWRTSSTAVILAEDDYITVDDCHPRSSARAAPPAHGTPIATQLCLRDQLREFEAGVIFRMLDETAATAALRRSAGHRTVQPVRKMEEFEAFGLARNPSGERRRPRRRAEQGMRHVFSR